MQEEKEILQMLSDKVINVDEAERLLNALGSRQKRAEGSEMPPAGARRTLQSALAGINESLSEIGPMIGSVIAEATSGLRDEDQDIDEARERGREKIELVDGKFKVEPGTRLIIRNDRVSRSGMSGKNGLTIEGIEGDHCHLNDDEIENLSVSRVSAGILIRWTSGDLSLQIPSTVDSIRAKTMGGNINVNGPGCEAVVKTMGGDMVMTGLANKFKAKTMGGNIRLELSPGWSGSSKAATMGGNIVAVIPTELSTEINAMTMGGEIGADEGIGTIHATGSVANRKSRIVTGNGGSDSSLHLKTMGGNINIKTPDAG